MCRLYRRELPGILALLVGFAAFSVARADALSAVQVLRQGGCGGMVPLAQPLRHNVLLDRAAEEWATGRSLAAAAEDNGYRGDSAAGVYLRGSDSSLLEQMRRTSCRALTGQALREMGTYTRGQDTWVVVTAAYTATLAPASAAARVQTAPPAGTGWQFPATPQLSAPPPGQGGAGPLAVPPASSLAGRALQLVNDVRARGARCGRHSFGPAPPLTLSGTLDGVALGHATDMAQNNYFNHEDLAGQTPADRVRAVGYREKLVGENIAYGPQTVEEVVQGWLDSPDHCENIMDPRFAQMGIAYASGRATRHGLYWVQVLAAPRA
jgi:uncharacterized protein YkwD